MLKKQNIISALLTSIVIGLLFFSGPVVAVTVSLSQPNNAYRGNNVGFSITVDVNNPDGYLPIKYTNIIINGPSGFSKVCRVNMDGSDNCMDVDISLSIDSNLGYGFGAGYGYDSAVGYGYNFGNNYGYGYANAYGSIIYTIVWYTSSNLNTGAYTARADVRVEGSSGSHDYSSNVRSFSILNTPYYPPASCSENWYCNTWSECPSSGTQMRSCTDLNSCGTVNNKPAEVQSCVFTPTNMMSSSSRSDKDSRIKPPPADLVFPNNPKAVQDKSEEKAIVVIKNKNTQLFEWDGLSFVQKIFILNVASLFTAFAMLFNPIKENIPDLRIKK